MSENTLKTWFAVDILVAPHATEAIEFAFNELGSLGTEIDSLKKGRDAPQRVTGFFDGLPSPDDIEAAVSESLRIYGVAPDAVTAIDNRVVVETDWLAEWKRHWKPTTVGKFIIAPPWSDVPETDKVVIRIEPNMAFGTGTHETTRLCLKAIGDNYRGGMSFLDVGTGTGILAIAVAKLAAENTGLRAKILALDTDRDSVKIARENAAANGVGDRIDLFEGPISAATPAYDLVSANLTIDVIVPILPLLIEKAGALLLVSGILVEQENTIKKELAKQQVSNFEIARSGEWVSVLIAF